MSAPLDKIIFSLRPLFVGWATLTALLPFALFFGLWFGVVFRNLFNISLLRPGALAFVLLLGLGYIAKKLNYSRTEYRFYDDRLEFDEGFFALNRKTIDYRDVISALASTCCASSPASEARCLSPSSINSRTTSTNLTDAVSSSSALVRFIILPPAKRMVNADKAG